MVALGLDDVQEGTDHLLINVANIAQSDSVLDQIGWERGVIFGEGNKRLRFRVDLLCQCFKPHDLIEDRSKNILIFSSN